MKMTIEQQEDALIPVAKTRKSSSVLIENKPTPYYSACEQELDDLPPQKRPGNNEDTISDVPRKLSRLDISHHHEDTREEQQPKIRRQQQQQQQQRMPKLPPDFKPEKADFKTNRRSFGFLQSLSPAFDSAYLREITENLQARTRPGFLLGRSSTCDLVLGDNAVSKRHCLIYMETGAQGQNRGIRIYLKDMSSNGTYHNGSKMEVNQRLLLKHNDIIALRVPKLEEHNDCQRPVYRVIFPDSYDATRCESMYTRNKVLGNGSFASVFAAKEKTTGKLVAIKRVLKAKYDAKPKLLQSVIRESNALMSFEEHPFVIKIEKVYLEEKYFYLILEYSPDGDLFNYITENKRLPERKARFIFWQLFSAMQFVHNRGVAHRDLKPENVLMISKDRLHVKVADFGLARHTVGNESFTSQCGTPNYVAPEVLLKSRAYDERCDIWSLGVILYICLCGYTPFSDVGSTPMKEQILNGDYNFDTIYWQNISEQAKSLVQSLMTVNLTERITLEHAMDHPWMKMEPHVMKKYQNDLGMHHIERSKELLNVEELSNTMRV